jgi:hypothetical protein
MKTKILFIFFIFICSYSYSQQTEFMIGADWLKNTVISSMNQCITSGEWNNIKDLGIKYGRIYLSNDVSLDLLNAIRDKTFYDADTTGIKVFLD